MNWQDRTRLLLGEQALGKLRSSSVAVVGVGGVGAAAAEMLVRSGVGKIVLVDSDEVGQSNINRQLIALHSTVGKKKVEVLKERLQDINPELEVIPLQTYVHEDTLPGIEELSKVDFIVDAIDTLSPKIALIQYCLAGQIHFVSSMGSGAKMDVTKVKIADISKSYECPLAHMLRKRLHHLGVREGFPVVFSSEKPMESAVILEESANKKSQVGTISYLPTVFGCACAQVAINFLIQ